jgi:hypothetical protein
MGKSIDKAIKAFAKTAMRQLEEIYLDLLYTVASSIASYDDFTEVIGVTHKKGHAFLQRIVEELFEQTDQKYAEDRPDKSEIIITHSRSKKTITTIIGPVELNRNRYLNKNTKEGYYFIDELYNIDAHQRIDKGLQAKLIEEVTNSSYRKTSAIYNDLVSHQSVYNVTKRGYESYLEVVQNEQEIERSDCLNIYIEADEDHVHMKDRSNKIAKLIYVHEGYKNETLAENGSPRYKIVNAKYFTEREGQDIWEDVHDYVMARYKRYAHVMISGDGASWIKRGLQYFPLAEFNLDRFHIMQTATRLFPRHKDKRAELINALIVKDRDYLISLYERRYKRTPNPTSLKTQNTMRGLAYLINNLDNINLTEFHKKCSAEGHISHVLSARFSSRPQAWTREGLERLAMFRCERYNKFDFTQLFKDTGRTELSEACESIKYFIQEKKNSLKCKNTRKNFTRVNPCIVHGINPHRGEETEKLKNLL